MTSFTAENSDKHDFRQKTEGNIRRAGQHAPVLVTWGFWNSTPQVWRLQTTAFYSFTLQTKSLKPGRWQSQFLLGDSGETLVYTIAGFWWQLVILVDPCATTEREIHPTALCSGFFNNFLLLLFRVYFISVTDSSVTSLSWDRKRTLVRTKKTRIHRGLVMCPYAGGDTPLERKN